MATDDSALNTSAAWAGVNETATLGLAMPAAFARSMIS
jgi:hypothetical protein